MSVVITNYEMPECCDVCLFSCWSNLHQTCSCKLKEYEPGFQDFSSDYKIRRSDICPLEERKTGRWIKLDMHAHLANHKCTACGQECYVPTFMGEPMYTYCPNCGARMDGEVEGKKK